MVEIVEMAAGGAAWAPPQTPPPLILVGGVDWWLVVGEVGTVELSRDLGVPGGGLKLNRVVGCG